VGAGHTVRMNVLMVGAGEYNVGYVPTAAGAAADKRCGVTAICLFDMRRRGMVNRILLADADGTRLPLARACMAEKIGAAYKELDTTVECWPKDETATFDPAAPAAAMDTLSAGDLVIVFTPDPTHFSITSAAIERGLHVLVAKPVVKVLREHLLLEAAAAERRVLVAVEYHKRWDPIYSDARERARKLGDFSFFNSMMTQRRVQLDTFAAWAGKSSDISYYLNSHHIDILCWMVEGVARPEQVAAAASFGVADAHLKRPGVEDTISLMCTVREGGGAVARAFAPPPPRPPPLPHPLRPPFPARSGATPAAPRATRSPPPPGWRPPRTATRSSTSTTWATRGRCAATRRTAATPFPRSPRAAARARWPR
jgi:D-galacturonate reductase